MAIKQAVSYEGMFLLPPSAGVDVEKSVAMVKTLVEKHGGTATVIKKWDERKIAYEVKKQKRGLYVIAYFTGPGSMVTPLEREVSLSEDFLRVLITHADHLNETEMNAVEPQPIQPREERAPWDRPGFNNDGPGSRPRRDDAAPAPAAAGASKE